MSKTYTPHAAGGIIASIPGVGILEAQGTSVPTGAGYAPGCVFHKINGSAGTTLYVNEGSVTSASFVALGTAGTGGAAAIGILDAGAFTAQTTVEAALAELYQDTLSTQGFIPIPLTSFRLIASNDIGAKNAVDGGTISLDTDPIYKRINAATDKGLRITWAASSVIEITAPFVYPPDLDDAAALTVNLRGKMAGAADTPVVAVGYFEGVGDTNAGGNSAAFAATMGTKSVTIAAADVGAFPNFASISLTPGTHGTDVLELYGVYILYKKKLLTS